LNYARSLICKDFESQTSQKNSRVQTEKIRPKLAISNRKRGVAFSQRRNTKTATLRKLKKKKQQKPTKLHKFSQNVNNNSGNFKRFNIIGTIKEMLQTPRLAC